MKGVFVCESSDIANCWYVSDFAQGALAGRDQKDIGDLLTRL